MAEKVYTKNAPDAIGPYTQAIKTNGFVFTSGQIAINPQTGNVEATTIEGQTEQVMKNLGAILAEAGSSFDKAVKTVCFLADMGDFAVFNEIYGKFENIQMFPGIGADLSQRLSLKTNYKYAVWKDYVIIYKVGKEYVEIYRVINRYQDIMRIFE